MHIVKAHRREFLQNIIKTLSLFVLRAVIRHAVLSVKFSLYAAMLAAEGYQFRIVSESDEADALSRGKNERMQTHAKNGIAPRQQARKIRRANPRKKNTAKFFYPCFGELLIFARTHDDPYKQRLFEGQRVQHCHQSVACLTRGSSFDGYRNHPLRISREITLPKIANPRFSGRQ